MKLTRLLSLAALVLIAVPAGASTYDWTFQLADGTLAQFEMVGQPVYCVYSPKSTFTITAGSQVYTSSLCQNQGGDAEQFFGQFPSGADHQAAAFFIDIGASYHSLMKQFQQYGTGGDLGNSVNGQCGADADAFLTLPGESLGDKSVVGYCMVPKSRD